MNWEDETEVAEVPTLLALWSKNAPIDVADALKLLSKCVTAPKMPFFLYWVWFCSNSVQSDCLSVHLL